MAVLAEEIYVMGVGGEIVEREIGAGCCWVLVGNP